MEKSGDWNGKLKGFCYNGALLFVIPLIESRINVKVNPQPLVLDFE